MSGQFLASLIVVVVLLSVARVFFANWLVESSETLRSFDQQIASQTRENQQLSETLRSSRSLSDLESQIASLGFIKQTKLSFILPEPSVAWRTGDLSVVR